MTVCSERVVPVPKWVIFTIFCYRDDKRQTPYIVAPDKDTRNVFRKYMGENPDKYDYSKAQVRGNGTPTNDMYIKQKQSTYGLHLCNSRSLGH